MTHVLAMVESRDGVGRGEAAGVYYLGDSSEGIAARIEDVRARVEAGEVDRISLQALLPPGGARNALDCALWDLEAKIAGVPVAEMAGVGDVRPLVTTFTCSAEAPDDVARLACGFADARAIKLKLSGDGCDAARVQAVRAALPGVWLGVDANQGLTAKGLIQLLPVLLEADVQMIEQPLPVGEEAQLEGVPRAIPIIADESVQDSDDLRRLAARFDGVNIKLDKCGGLTEGLAMVHLARELGLKAMVGNMMGTSLASAPAFVLGQFCDIVDLDGPLFLADDRSPSAVYRNGSIWCPRELWGG